MGATGATKRINNEINKTETSQKPLVVNSTPLFNCIKNDLKKYECRDCDFKTDCLLNLTKHSTSIQDEELDSLNTFVCKNCNFETISRLICFRHMLTCTKRNENIKDFICMRCCLCDYKTKYWRYLKKHVIFKHQAPELVKWFTCEYCSYKAKDKTNLKRHKIQHKVKNILEHRTVNAIKKTEFEKEPPDSLVSFTPLFDCTKSNNIQKYECGSCDFTTDLLCNFVKHSFTVKAEDFKLLNTFFCKYCNFETFSQLICLKHSLTCSRRDDSIREFIYLKCCQCDYETKYWRYLKRHVVLNHEALDSINWFECEYCTYQTRNKIDLKEHKTQHRGDLEKSARVKCKSCPYRAVNYKRLSLHVQRTHFPIENYYMLHECTFCSTKFQRSNQLKRHLILEHSSLLKCIQCKFQGKTFSRLLEHIQTKHVMSDLISWYECDQCSFKAKYRNVIRTHKLYKHTSLENITWYRCQICSYKGKTKGNLDRHVRKHTSPEDFKWYECDQCPHKVKKLESIKKHILQKHTAPEDIKWIECDQCLYKFRHKDELRAHIHLKHSDVWYKCDKCPYRTKQNSDLKRHTQTKHTPEEDVKWWSCELCEYKTKRQQNLKIHMKMKHTAPQASADSPRGNGQPNPLYLYNWRLV